MSILTQINKIAQAVISNGLTTGNQVQNPDNLLNTTDSTALFGATSDVIIGNFPFSIPGNAVIVGISGILRARINNSSIPAGSTTPVLVDSSSGVNQYFPGAPVTGLSDVLQDYDIGGAYDIWANIDWTPDKINNLKLQLIGNSALEVAWASMTVYYYIPQTQLIPPPFQLPGCADCDSTIQALPFELAEPWLVGDTKLKLKSFNLPNEEPITLAMLGECGGTINLTIDPDKRKEDGGNFIENFNLLDSIASITLLSNGLVELDIGDIHQRGLGFDTPYGYDADNISEHAVGAVIIITNNGPWNGKLLKRCHIGTLVSAPIEVQDEGDTVAVAVDKFNFIGDDVQAEQDPGDPRKVNITVVGTPTNTQPTVENTATGTNNTTPSLTLTIPLTVTDANYLRAGIITENETIISVTYNGVPLGLVVDKVNPGVNLKTALYDLINPAVGTHNLVITMLSSRIITGIITGWKDVDVSSPVDGVSAGNIGTSNAPTDIATTSTENTIMQDVVGTTNNPTTFNQFGLWSIQGAVTTGIRPGASSSRRVLAPATVTDLYNISVSTGWSICMAGIRGITNTPSGSGIQSINADTTPAQILDNTDTLIGISQPIAGTNRFRIILANLIAALLNSASFINGLISIFTTGNSTFINALTSNTFFQTNVNNFVTGGGSTINVNQFDDFVSNYLSAAKGGSISQISVSGNFVAFNSGTNAGLIPTTETNHPGIFTSLASNQPILGFVSIDPGSTGTNTRLLPADSDWSFEILSRIDTSGTPRYRWEINNSGGNILMEITNALVRYDIGGGFVNTAVPVPATNTWFKVFITYISGILTIKINNNTVFTGAVVIPGTMSLQMTNINGIGFLGVDYVKTNYQVTR